MKVAPVHEMQALDRSAVEDFGIPDIVLMENAGLAVVEVVTKKPQWLKGCILVVAGPGNNGGDGLVVARKLQSLGKRVKLALVCDPSNYRGSAGINWAIAKPQFPDSLRIDEASLHAFRSILGSSSCVIDAILGTGLTRDVGGILAETIELINNSGKPVVSVDIPSGIDGDTGQVCGHAIWAHSTVTFGLPKVGNLVYPGYSNNGRIFLSSISLPLELQNRESIQTEINFPVLLPRRKAEGHKGTFGHALIIGGAKQYYGAPIFSSMSFLKSGGGYSRLAAPESMIPHLASRASEIVYLPQDEK